MADETLPSPMTSVQERSFLRGKGRLVIAGMLLAAAFSYLGFLGFQGSTVYYLTVTEATSRGSAAQDTLRISGKLAPESFQRESGSTVASFTLVDPETGQVLSVTHDGVVPDLFFNEHSEIVAEGALDADGVFHSDLIIVKCPTKYAPSADFS